MKKFVRVVNNYSKDADDFDFDSCIQEELIPIKSLLKVYKYKGGKPMLAYVWKNPVNGFIIEWFQIFYNDRQRDARFDKLEKLLC